MHHATRRQLLRRLDAVARELNIALAVIAIGLAVLDVTFAVSQRVLERLPITRIVCDDGAAASPVRPESTRRAVGAIDSRSRSR